MRFVTAALLLALSSTAFAATPILSNIKAGKFDGTLSSNVSKSINGLKAGVDVQKTTQGTLMTFKVAGAPGQEREEWLVQGTDLIQKEFDKDGKLVQTYKATMIPSKPATAGEATFAIHCANKAKNECDGDIDSRNAWTIGSDGNSLTYTVWGVEKKEDYNNPAAKVMKRHEFAFTASR